MLQCLMIKTFTKIFAPHNKSDTHLLIFFEIYEMEHYIFDFNLLNLLPRCMFFTPTKKLKRLV